MFVRNTRVALECVNIGTPITVAYPSDKAVKDIAAIAAYCAALKPAASSGVGQPRIARALGERRTPFAALKRSKFFTLISTTATAL